MSTDYKLENEISMAELFGGKLKSFGINEHVIEGKTSKTHRYLSDGENGVVVYGDCTVSMIKRCGANCPNKILSSISIAFGTRIYSEFDPQFWGFESQEEWDKYESKVNTRRASKFHTDSGDFEQLNGPETDLVGRALSESDERKILGRKFFESLRS